METWHLVSGEDVSQVVPQPCLLPSGLPSGADGRRCNVVKGCRELCSSSECSWYNKKDDMASTLQCETKHLSPLRGKHV